MRKEFRGTYGVNTIKTARDIFLGAPKLELKGGCQICQSNGYTDEEEAEVIYRNWWHRKARPGHSASHRSYVIREQRYFLTDCAVETRKSP